MATRKCFLATYIHCYTLSPLQSMAPKSMHRYSYASLLEKDCIQLAFYGERTLFWNKSRQQLEYGNLYCLPMRWIFDMPEINPWTGCISQNCYCPCRVSARVYTDLDDFGSHCCWDDNSWCSGRIIYGNVRWVVCPSPLHKGTLHTLACSDCKGCLPQNAFITRERSLDHLLRG